MITLSSCEAEFVALCSMILEVRYSCMILEELGNPREMGDGSWEDNKAAVVIAEAESSSAGQAKHIDVRFKKVVESVRDGTVRVRYVTYVPTDWNYVDIMTKALGKTKFKEVREMYESRRNEKGTMLRLINEMVMLISD